MFKKSVLAATISLLSFNSFGSAYQIFEQDAGTLGTYHAGNGARADRASTNWYNPAGMVHLDSTTISNGIALANTDVEFSGTQKHTNLAGLSEPFSADGGGLIPIPNFHFVMPVNDDVALGFSVLGSFGAVTDFDDSTRLKYNGLETNLQTITIAPSIGYKLSSILSVGAGIDINYTKGIFTNIANISPALPQFDAKSENEGDNINYGYRLGVLFSPSEYTRIGLTYHAKVKTTLEGDSDLTGGIADTLPPIPNDQERDFKTDIILPAYWDLSAYHEVNDKWSIMASAVYTEWSAVKEFRLENVRGAVSSGYIDVVIPQNYDDTFNLALGTEYKLNNKWTIKGGLGYDMTPTNDDDRVINVPDQDRMIVSTGVNYQFNDNLELSFNYAHIFVEDADVSATTNINGTLQTAMGKVKTSADVIGLQASYTF